MVKGMLKRKIKLEQLKRRWQYSKKRFVAPEGMKTPFISIILLNQNGRDSLEILMKSMEHSRFYDNFEIVFVDNVSKDDSVSYMESWKEKFQITMVSGKEGMTFSEGNNAGAAQAKGDCLLFLNDNTEVTDGWLDELLQAMYTADNPGAIGARLIYPEIPENSVDAGKSYKIQHAGVGFKDVLREKQYFIQPYNLGNGAEEYGNKTGIMERACVTSAVMLMRKSAYDAVGGFDETYVYGYEDVDICLKLVKAGYHNYYCADSMVFHYEFGTQSLGNDQTDKERGHHNTEVFKGKWQRYLFRKILKEKLEQGQIFTETGLHVAIAVERPIPVAVSEFIEALKKKNVSVTYIKTKKEKAKYKVGVETDVLLSFDKTYDVRKLVNDKHDLVKAACILKGDDTWEAVECLTDYDFVLKAASGEELVQMLWEKLDSFVTERVNDHEIDICGAMPDYHGKVFWGDYHFAVALQKEFERKGYRANILTKEHWYDKSSAKYTLVLRGLKEYYPSMENDRFNMMWNISHPDDVTIPEYNLFGAVFFASEYMKQEFEPKITPPAFTLLQCTDEKVMTYEEGYEGQYELLFIGNSRKVFRQILKDLLPTQYQLSVYGRGWDEYPVKEYVVSEYLDNAKIGQAYHDAQILLNDHWEDMKKYGIISNRIFDALAAGAFIISDDVFGLQETLGEAVVTYQNREDLNQKIDYYLQQTEEREKRAQMGQRIVLEKHTFAHRVESILEVMKQ